MVMRRISQWKSLAVCLLLLVVMLPWPGLLQVNAEVPESIRVSLFIESRGTVPSITAKAQGLQLELQTGGNAMPISVPEEAATVRASLDQYRLLLTETTELSKANDLTEDWAGLFQREFYVFETDSPGNTSYEVMSQPFSTEAEAKKLLQEMVSFNVLEQNEALLIGPYYLHASTYASADKANAQLQLVQQSGLHGRLVYHSENGQPVFSVWIAGAVDEESLSKLKSEASDRLPGVDLSIADTTGAYAILQQEVRNRQSYPHFQLSGHDAKLIIDSKQEDVTIVERNSRSYRGSMEVTTYRHQLALINELPLEHYLYSVVSAEMGAGWPREALKAQAVAARTYAIRQGMKYDIAHISDTTYDQAYYGSANEHDDTRSAVDETAGEVLVNGQGEWIEPFYHSNAGGMTADGTEIWGNEIENLKMTPSPDDGPEKYRLEWDRIVLSNGEVGYIRTDFTSETGTFNSAGFELLEVLGTDVNVRKAPYVNNADNPPIAQVSEGDVLLGFDKQMESNAYRWVRGPFTAFELQQHIESRTGISFRGESLHTLEVSERGPSGRVIEVKANDEVVEVSTPDAYRSVLGGLNSTRFEIVNAGAFTVLGANNQVIDNTDTSASLYALSADNSTAARPVTADDVFVVSGEREVRLLSPSPSFYFYGWGNGHGLGMSQWGARELAEYMGYDYQEILLYYYEDVAIVKE